MADVVEVRLPSHPDYLPVLRATVGALAGAMLFNYDDITQLRIAVTEAFNLSTRWLRQIDASDRPNGIRIDFVVATGSLEIIVRDGPEFAGPINLEREEESRIVLESLMDAVGFGDGVANTPLISMTKYNVVNAS